MPTAVVDCTQPAPVSASQERKEQPSLRARVSKAGRTDRTNKTDRERARDLQYFATGNCNLRIFASLTPFHTNILFFPSLIVRSSAKLRSARLPIAETAGKGPLIPRRHTEELYRASPRARTPLSRPSFTLSSSLFCHSRLRLLEHRAPFRASRPLFVLATGLDLFRSHISAILRLVCLTYPPSCLGICPSSVSLTPLFDGFPFRRPTFELAPLFDDSLFLALSWILGRYCLDAVYRLPLFWFTVPARPVVWLRCCLRSWLRLRPCF